MGYLHEFRHKLTHRIEFQNLSDTGAATAPQVKELDKLKLALKDVEDYEREILLPLARRQLSIDLYDGVKVNYLKFGKALPTIPGLAKKEKKKKKKSPGKKPLSRKKAVKTMATAKSPRSKKKPARA